MPLAVFEPAVAASEQPQTMLYTAWPLGSAGYFHAVKNSVLVQSDFSG
jgi:hypothetical protein